MTQETLGEIIAFVCKDCEEHRNLELNESTVGEEPFNPRSQRLITVSSTDGQDRIITIQQWLKELDTNGRGGT